MSQYGKITQADPEGRCIPRVQLQRVSTPERVYGCCVRKDATSWVPGVASIQNQRADTACRRRHLIDLHTPNATPLRSCFLIFPYCAICFPTTNRRCDWFHFLANHVRIRSCLMMSQRSLKLPWLDPDQQSAESFQFHTPSGSAVSILSSSW